MLVHIITKKAKKCVALTVDELVAELFIGLACKNTDRSKYYLEHISHSVLFTSITKAFISEGTKQQLINLAMTSSKFVAFHVFDTEQELYKWMSEKE